MRNWSRIFALVVLGTSTIGCDRVSKQLARQQLAGGPRRSFLADTVRLDYVENRGAFLSLGAELPDRVRTPLLTGATALLLVSLGVVLVRRRATVGLDAVGLSLVWAGGVSNLADRVTHGSVVDFLNVGVGSFRTGIFNLADVAITIGGALVVLASTIGSHRIAQGDASER
jgi:signal peptidase II